MFRTIVCRLILVASSASHQHNSLTSVFSSITTTCLNYLTTHHTSPSHAACQQHDDKGSKDTTRVAIRTLLN